DPLFNRWPECLTSRSTYSSYSRRKRKNKKQEDPPEDQHPPHGQSLQKEEGAPGTENGAKETGDEAPEEGPSPGKTEPQKDAKALGLSWELSPPISKSFPVHLPSESSGDPSAFPYPSPLLAQVVHWPHQGVFWQFMDMKIEKRLVNVHKRYQSGQVFSPFQALTTSEMRRLVFPRDVPMSSDAQRVGPLSLQDIRLQDLPLSSTELGLEKDDKPHENRKRVNHPKTPLFPPIEKATKYNDMK
uniref:Uncharacterized protein n=1 Tax=Spermophilus dauricus TaxID=99837 RepID=A0A8C9UT46_SPEDA